MDQPSATMWWRVSRSRCSSGSEPQQGGAQQRSGREVERRRGLGGGQAPSLPVPGLLRQRGEIDQRQADLGRRRRPAGAARRRPRRRWCAASRGGGRSRRSGGEHRGIRAAREPDRGRDVVAALPGWSWSRNQSRSWAKESGSLGSPGTRSGTRPAGRPGPPARPPRPGPPAWGSRTGRRTGSSTPSSSRRRETTRVASSEWPPSAKKSSSRPIRGRPRARSTPRRSGARAGSRGSAAAGFRRQSLQEGQRLAVHLAARVQRQLRQEREGRGHHVGGQRAAEEAAQLRGLRRPPGGRRRRPRAGPRRRPGARERPRRRHRRVRRERRLDLLQLDAEAADLDLVVDAPQELDARRPGGSGRGRPCGRRARPAPPKGSGMNRAAVRSGRPR